MAGTLTPILSKDWDHATSWTLKTYREGGGYKAWFEAEAHRG